VQDETINRPDGAEGWLYPTIFKDGGTTPPPAAPDGASAMLIMTASKAAELGYTPLAHRTYGYAGSSRTAGHCAGICPAQGAGAEPADRHGLVEINEALAQVLAVGQALAADGWDWKRVNVNGGAIALGHPVGSSGCRIVVTLLHEMKRRNADGKQPVRYGLATLCAAGGQGSALIIEAMPRPT
jgi:acetyl-CoA C-acetyltransferase